MQTSVVVVVLGRRGGRHVTGWTGWDSAEGEKDKSPEDEVEPSRRHCSLLTPAGPSPLVRSVVKIQRPLHPGVNDVNQKFDLARACSLANVFGRAIPPDPGDDERPRPPGRA